MKERLDIAFHNRIADLGSQNQENVQLLRLEKMTIRDKEMHNRRIIESIESNLKIKVSKEPKIQESDICRAYQTLLSEHFKRNNRKLKENSQSMKIKIKMDDLEESKRTDEEPDEDKDNGSNESSSQTRISKKKQGTNAFSIYKGQNLIFYLSLKITFYLTIQLSDYYFRKE